MRYFCFSVSLLLVLGSSQSALAENTSPSVAEFPGQIEVLNSHNISNLIDGVVTGVHFKPGQFVEAGDVLFSIDPALYELALKTRRLNTVRAKTALASARQDLERIKKLKDRGSATEVQLLKAELALDVGEAMIEQAKAELKLAEFDLEATKIQAPISGVISRSEVYPGAYVETGREPLARIDQMDPVRLSYKLPYVERIEQLVVDDLRSPSEVLDKFTLQIRLSETWVYSETTKPENISSRVDPSDGTLTVWSELANPNFQLRPGMSVTVLSVMNAE
jgi:membrane fusion protein (multidrug efflux system)